MMFRKGDRVSVEGIVEFDEELGESVFVRIEDYHASLITKAEKLKLVAQVYVPGDEVFVKGFIGKRWKVLAVDGEWLWVISPWGFNDRSSFRRNRVTPAPPRLVAPAAPPVAGSDEDMAL